VGTWESEFACVVCFSRVCYFRRVVSFAYSLSVLDDLPMNLVSCIAAVCLQIYKVLSKTTNFVILHTQRHVSALQTSLFLNLVNLE